MPHISEDEYKEISEILKKHVPGCEVRAFGSRCGRTAKKYKEYSDLDLAVVCDEVMPYGRIDELREAFQESELPFRVDVLDYYAVSEEFLNVIDAGYEVLGFGEKSSA